MPGRDRRSTGTARRSSRSANHAADQSASAGRIYFDRAAVLRGALGGAAVIALLSVLWEGVRRLSGASAGGPWLVVFLVGILGALLFAGWVTAGWARRGRPTHGAVASLGALAGWVLLRSVGSALGGGEPGFDVAVLAPAAVGALVLGALGGVWRSRRSARAGGRLP